MTWNYSQSTGRLAHDQTGTVGVCYSGHGAGLNNGALEWDVGVGPIPKGAWVIDPWEDEHDRLGPIVAHLTPQFDPHGRSGFFIHGDNADLNHTASDGCIIANKLIRMAMRSSGDTDLMVTA